MSRFLQYAAAFLLLLTSNTGRGQTGQQTRALPIEAHANPQRATPGSAVKIEGNTEPFAAQPSVAITVISPSGIATTLAASVNSAGAFSLFYRQTNALGQYRIIVIAPDGKGSARAAFNVVSGGTMDSAVVEDVEHALELAAGHVSRFEEMIGSLPLSPPKSQVQSRISNLEQQIVLARSAVRDLGPVLEKIGQLRGQASDQRLESRFQELTDKLGAYDNDARNQIPALDAKLSAYTHENLVCDQVDHVTEGFKLLSALLNFGGRPFTMLVNFAKDVNADAARGLISQPGAQLIASTVVKNTNQLISDSALAPVTNLATFAADLSAFISEQVFEAYCQRFTGPLQGSMEASFENQGDTWWEYSFDLIGRVVLRYPKNAQDPVRVTGQMEGLGTNFSVKENALRVLFPKLMNGSVLFHMTKLPWFNSGVSGALFSQAMMEGSGFAAQMPNSFYFPIEGDLQGENLTLRLGGKQIDFEGKTADVFYFIASPYTLLNPVVTFALPFKGARFAIGRALNDAPTHLTIKMQGNMMVLEQEFSEKRNAGETTGTYTLKLKACNPGCSPAPASVHPL
jgi:hypothetical protein